MVIPTRNPISFYIDQAAVQDPDWVRGPYAEQRALRTLRGPTVPHRADRDQATQVRACAFSTWLFGFFYRNFWCPCWLADSSFAIDSVQNSFRGQRVPV